MSAACLAQEIPALNLGQRLRVSRENALIDQHAMAKLLEISRGAISNWERNVTAPKGLYLAKWAQVTNVNEQWLRFGNPDPEGPGLQLVRREGLEPPTRWLWALGLYSRFLAYTSSVKKDMSCFVLGQMPHLSCDLGNIAARGHIR